MVNRVVKRDLLQKETMELAQRIALQDSFALRLSKASINQVQDQMGFRNGIMSGFHSHAIGLSHRRDTSDDEVASKDLARKRDEKFGDRA